MKEKPPFECVRHVFDCDYNFGKLMSVIDTFSKIESHKLEDVKIYVERTGKEESVINKIVVKVSYYD